MTSLWQMTGPTIDTDAFRAEARDAIVVGAGLTGLMTAVLLARAGQRVTVLEGRAVGALTTGNTTGKLSLLQGTVFSQLRRHAGDDALRAYAEANREGQAWLLRQLQVWGVSPELRPAYTYATDLAHLETLEQEREASWVAGIEVAESEADEIGLPYATAGAITLPAQAQVQPMTVLDVLARELRGRGGEIVTGCRVRDVDEGVHSVRVITDHGTIAADLCVLATGMPILDRGMFFAKLTPSRSYAAAYQLDSAAAPQGMYVSVGEPPRSLRTAWGTNGQELLVVGGGSHVVGQAGSTRGEIAELDTWVREIFGPAERVTWWGAQDYRGHSRLPFAGLMPRSGGRIYTATGYNKWGMTNAVAAALTIAADILGGNLTWAQTLREQSLRLATVTDALETNASVAAHLVAGWVAAEAHSIHDASAPEEGEGIVVRDGLAPVGLSRLNGELCRVSAVCPHLGGVLAWNAAEASWDCPLHGSRFAADGERLEGPAVDDLTPG